MALIANVVDNALLKAHVSEHDRMILLPYSVDKYIQSWFGRFLYFLDEKRLVSEWDSPLSTFDLLYWYDGTFGLLRRVTQRQDAYEEVIQHVNGLRFDETIQESGVNQLGAAIRI